MDSFKYDSGAIIANTSYFQECLDNLLSVLQASFLCLDLIIKVLIHGPDGYAKRLLAKKAAETLSMNFCEERVADLFDENIVGTEKKVRAAIAKAATSAPCLVYWSGYELFCKLDDSDLDRIEHIINESLEELLTDKRSQPIVFVADTEDFQDVFKSPLSYMFQHFTPVKSPTKSQAEEILRAIVDGVGLKLEPNSLLERLSDGEYFMRNLMNLLAKAEFELYQETRTENEEGTNQTVEAANEKKGTRWLDIGGLAEVKREIIDTIQLSIDFPQLRKSGLRRTGILLYGPPGTGKTLLAKAVATECGLNFINVKGPELLNQYVGQSEDNVRRLFQKARESSPSVIFFDELDSLAPNRGQAGDSGGVMDRMVSQILAEMDGVGKSDDLFVIGATNRVDLVDPSLLRPGRFDKVLEVPLPVSKESRLQILKALTRKMKLADDVDLDVIETEAQAGMSGADFQSLCSRAMHKTLDRCIEQVKSGQATENDTEIITNLEDFRQSLSRHPEKI